MISGLKGATYEEKLREIGLTTLEECRHQADMLQAFKTIRGFDNVASATWFQRVDVSIRTTRCAADPFNLKSQAGRLETRRNFFSNRVVEA
jgi:DNA polymerase/3'-5' exonuclease PolX